MKSVENAANPLLDEAPDGDRGRQPPPLALPILLRVPWIPLETPAAPFVPDAAPVTTPQPPTRATDEPNQGVPALEPTPLTASDELAAPLIVATQAAIPDAPVSKYRPRRRLRPPVAIGILAAALMFAVYWHFPTTWSGDDQTPATATGDETPQVLPPLPLTAADDNEPPLPPPIPGLDRPAALAPEIVPVAPGDVQ